MQKKLNTETVTACIDVAAKLWQVPVTMTVTNNIEVKANEAWAAEELAVEKAKIAVFDTKNADYEPGPAEEMEGEPTKAKEMPSIWDEDPLYPVSDWQHEVACDYTRSGYREWLLVKHES